MTMLKSVRLAATATLLAAATTALAQETSPSDDVIATGRLRFERNCALCHGTDGRGFGPFLTQLNKKPPDLRLLSRNNAGYFPLKRVYDAIDGRMLPSSHGTTQMPIWGETFKSTVAGGSETLVRGRILELIMYLESIQADGGV
ncbi:MAG: cytochrome c [Gammaproteobacteria bacterium]|nr:cytochrome c [Gammaproteobacteria bacterium]